MHTPTASPRTALAAALFLIGWALTPIFVRYMSDAYDPYTQAFVRYASAALTLCVYASIFHRAELIRAIRHWRVLAPLSLVVIVMQLAWTLAIYNTTATMAQLVTTLQAPLVILLSFMVFDEERAVIRSAGYLGGTALCLVGVIAVFMREDGNGIYFRVDFALALLMFVSLAWSVYAVWGRHTAKGLHPVAMFTVISVYVSTGFVFFMFALGNPATLPGTPLHMHATAFVSGALCIAAAHCAFHHAQVQLGSAYCTTLQLLIPFLTHIIALTLWPDEALRPIQWAGGIMLIVGSFLVIRAKGNAPAQKATDA